MYRPITVKSRVRLPGDIISRLRLHQWSHPQPYQPGYLCGSPNLDWHLHATEGLPVLQNLQQNLRQPWARSPTIWLVHLLLHLPLRHPRQRDGSLHGHAWVAREPGIWRPQQERPHTQQQRTESWDNVSAFSYMERQTNISGLMAKLYMKRQAKSRERPCLWIEDRETKLHITQKVLVGFHPNLHHQTRRVLVHLFVYNVLSSEFHRNMHSPDIHHLQLNNY